MDIKFADVIELLHPMLVVAVVFPIIGLVINMAWQTRQRRVQAVAGGKSKIPPVVGQEHLKFGRWLTGSVVAAALLALANDIFKTLAEKHDWSKAPLILLMFSITIASLVLLYRAKERVWRGVFATLTGIGLVVVGCQDGVYRRTNEWYSSHYYYGMAAALLMIFSLAIVRDIYQDRSNRWRRIHIALNCIALLLFLGQAYTGTENLLEIPLSWQEKYIEKCDFDKLTCPAPPPAAKSQLPTLPPPST